MNLPAIAFSLMVIPWYPAQRELTKIPAPDPKRELTEFKLGDGLEIKLFASDPMIAKPIQMNWDSAGRLWVASSSKYPQLKPGEIADDKIIVLEDTNRDGVADKSTVFASGLLIPTGVLPGDGGVYVANSTELLHLVDTDGDGKADQKRVVLSGFGTEDTHHILHTLRWGIDGKMYFNQSIYIHSHVETPWGPRTLLGGGIWQFEPQNHRLEVYARGFVNSWGHVFDRWGQSLATDGAFGEGINHVFPGATFFTAVDAKRILHGMSPGQPKHCGLEMISGDHFPPEMRGTFVCNDFRGNRINRFALTPDGSSYSARQLPDLVSSSNVAFRPVDLRMGPDGALYVADWYNPIIQHGEVDFRDPRRDHAHGRIWRISFKGNPPLRNPFPAQASVEVLLENLKSSSGYLREKSRQELKNRADRPAVLVALTKWETGLDPNDPIIDLLRTEALWSYQSLLSPRPELLKTQLRSPAPFARAAALRILADWHEQIPESLNLLTLAIKDDAPRVRLEAILALHAIGTPRAVEIALLATKRELDANLDFALWQTANELADRWLPAYQSGQISFAGDLKSLIYAIKSSGKTEAVAIILQLLESQKVGASDLPAVLDLIAEQAGPTDVDRLWALTKTPQQPTAVYLATLERIASARKLSPIKDRESLQSFLTSEEAGIRLPAIRLAGLWQMAAARPTVEKIARASTEPTAARLAAVESLVAYGSSSRKLLRELSKNELTSIRVRSAAGLVMVDPPTGQAAVIELLGTKLSDNELAELLAPFLKSKTGPDQLAQALANQRLEPAQAERAIRVASSAGRDVNNLLAALRTAGKVTAMNVKLSAEEMRQMVADVAKLGDPARGEKIYRQAALQCLKCHAIGGAGGNVGPDLVSLGSSAPVDYIIESMLEPSKKIKEGFNTVTVAKDDGTVVSGILISKSATAIRLRDANAVEIVIPTANAESIKQSPVSLMPVDILKAVPRSDFVDLVRFLSELGKEGPYKVSPARLVRRWQSLEPTPELQHLVTRVGNQGVIEGQGGLQQRAVYSQVSGELPVEDLPLHRGYNNTDFSFVNFRIDVTKAGKIGLKIPRPAALHLWVGKEEIAVKPITEFVAQKGVQTLTFLIERNQRKAPLLVEVVDIDGSTGQAKLAP